MKKITFLLILFLSFSVFTQLNLDSLERILPNKKGAVKVKLMSDLCWEYGVSNPKKAEKYGKQAVELAQKIKNDTLLGLAYNDLGTLFLRIGEFEKAKKYYSQAIEIRTKLKDDIGLASIYSKLAVLEEIQSNYPKALEMNLKVLKIYEKKNEDSIAIATLCGNISVVLMNMQQMDRAYQYNKKAYEIGKKLNHIQLIGTSFANFGNLYSKQHKNRKAIDNFKKANYYFSQNNNLNSLAVMYNNIGSAYNNLNILDSASLYFEKSLKIRNEIQDRKGISSIQSSLASIYNKQKKPDLAIKYATQALAESKRLNTRENTQTIYSVLASSYALKGDFKRAYAFILRYIELKDKMFSAETTKQISEMSTKYETEKKESQILLLKKDKQVQEAKTERQKTITTAVVIGFILVLFVTIFIINRLLIIRKQKILIEQQKHLVEEKNKEITDSITYAKRIQSAILPQAKLIKESLTNSFILYKPKDIVAGDFYWMEPLKNGVIYAAADCTGHGVPGAMVSVVCHNALNRSVREFGISEPAGILNKTREIVVSEFEKSDTDVKDGMDISLCYLNLQDLEIRWAGANNPLWIIRNKELIEIKPDKQPIGKYSHAKPFTSHHVKLEKNDNIYIFTDGYQDQFGGPESYTGGKKLKISQMKEILISVSDLNMDDQVKIIDEKFEAWKGNLEQVDDVCIIGVKI